MSDVVVLVRQDDPDRKPMLYACPKCGRCHSPKIYSCSNEQAHAAAREAAANCYECRTHNTCTMCGGDCEKSRILCPACNRQRLISQATHVDAASIQCCVGLDSGAFYLSPEEAADDGEEYVFATTFRPYEAPTDIYETILDGHHEDASPSDLVGLDKLLAAIAEFNASQTGGSYDEDRSRIARVQPAATQADAGEGR